MLKETAKKYCMVLSAFFLLTFNGYSQDIHFTQYYASPLTLNPALTGFFDGDWRISGIYRNQWAAIGNKPYTTASLGFDHPFFIYSKQINFGIVYVNDQSGVINLTTNRLYLNLSYLLHAGKSIFALGVQPGMVKESYDLSKYTFNEQFDFGDPNIFNSKQTNGEAGYMNGISYFDVNAGAMWCYNQYSKTITPQFGISMMHLTRPNISFTKNTSDTSRLGMKGIADLSFIVRFSPKFRIVPRAMYSYQKTATELLCGTNVEQDLTGGSIKCLYGGALFRYGWNNNFDATSVIVGVKWKNFNIGYSYDINISSLDKGTNFRGAWEISIIYISPSSKPNIIKIPCDRL